MNHNNVKFPAEWESCEGILVCLPSYETDWNYILEESLEQYRRMIKCFTETGHHCIVLASDADNALELLGDCDPSKLSCISMDYNDTWTRDYGPIAVWRNDRLRALDFGFNGWGLKFAADRDNLVNLRLKEKFVLLPETYRNHRGFILEGGSLETDGEGTLLTTSRCLLSPNRNGGMSKAEVAEYLSEALGVSHILWLDYGALAGDDTDSHIDTLARMAPGNTILFTGCRDLDDEHFEELLKMRAQLTLFRNMHGEPYNLVELPMPDAVFDPQTGERLPATYANYLVTPTHIFMPVYSQPDKDRLACDTVRIAFPDHEVVPVECLTLLRQHGSLHCATMQLHKDLINPTLYES